MRKVVLLIVMCGFLSGCANTIKGAVKSMGEGINNSWSTLKRWDSNFQKNWW